MKTSASPYRLFIVLSSLLLSLGALEAHGQDAQSQEVSAAEKAPAVGEATPAEAVGPTDPAELEAFIDGVMAAQMKSRHIPAATISVVKDGKLFFAKGYGFADIEKKTPVEADKTMFRVGSTSKLFTWTAVMQLAERGKLDLDADVNTYLKTFKIPATYPEPITLKNLLTHTPGFEEGGIGYLIVKDKSKIVPLRESLAAHIPERVRPPGTWASYSNYGAALAGLIVENVSGMPFDDYIKKNILEPLDMRHSTFEEPLPKDLAPDMATSYKWKNGEFEPGFFEFIGNFGPAGSLSSTATDMANFMIAHLQLGRFDDHRILEEKTARLMHSRLFTADPRLPGMAYGFYQEDIDGYHAIAHGGDTVFFHSDLVLFPKQNVGLFVSYAANGTIARMELVDAFVKRYFPNEEPAVPKPPDGFKERAKEVAGTYRFTRRNWSDLEKVLTLPSVVSVTPKPDGTLVTSGIFKEPWHWTEVEPYLYRQIDGVLKLAFEKDKDGRVGHLVFSNFPFMPAYRIPWYDTPGFNYLLLGLALLLCVTTLVSFFLHRKERKLEPAGAKWAVRIAALVGLLTPIFFIIVIAIFSAGEEQLLSGYPPTLTAALMLPILTSILTIAVVYFAIICWKRKYWTRFRRLHYTLFAVLAVGLVWFYWYWNVLGVQYG